MVNKEDFFLSGAVESSPFYYDFPTVGAAMSVNSRAVILNQNGTCRFYLSKDGIKIAKNEWLSMDSNDVEKKFSQWLSKWKKVEKTLYNLAKNEIKDSLSVFKEILYLGKDFWLESYKVEVTDPYADELEKLVKKGLSDSGFDENFLYEMIAPQSPTKAQQIMIDRDKLKKGKMSKRDYIRKYWYSQGTWKGGEMLNLESLKREIEEKEIIPDLEKIKSIQNRIDSKLDYNVLNTIKILRILTLWREERKAYLQMINICLNKVLNSLSDNFKMSSKNLMWALPNEILKNKFQKKDLEERFRKSVYLLDEGKDKASILIGKEADDIFSEFYHKSAEKIVKGTVASKGKIIGNVRIVLREHQFIQFKDGEILITTMTRPEFVPLMRKASAIVTDEGGLTSHAAILARELKKPCVIGTRNATQVFENGDLIEVDADNGIVRIIKRV